MSIIIQGGSSVAGKANVDAGFNFAVTLPTNDTYVGKAAIVSQIDSGSVVGTQSITAPEATDDYRWRVGIDTPKWPLNFEGTVIAQDRIQQNLTSFTTVQGSGFLTLNAASSVTVAQGGSIRTYRTFSLYGPFNTYAELIARHTSPTATNAVSEWGMAQFNGIVATVVDGAFFRIASGGALTAVLAFNSTETSSATISTTGLTNRDTSTPFDLTKTQKYTVGIGFNSVRFWINDTLVATIPCPNANPLPTSASAQPIAWRVYNSGAASAARKLDVGFISGSDGDSNTGKPWPHIMAGAGYGGYQLQPGVTSGQTALYVNNTAPSAGTYTASTAPATGNLGGLWLSVNPIPVAAESDYPLFAWQNAIGSAVLPGKTFYCTGIRVGDTFVIQVLGANITVLTWAIACGSTASSLATADGAATVGPRRVALGAQSFAVTAPAGTIAPGFHVPFATPLVVPPGCFLHVINRFLINAATGQLRGSVGIDGYFE